MILKALKIWRFPIPHKVKTLCILGTIIMKDKTTRLETKICIRLGNLIKILLYEENIVLLSVIRINENIYIDT